MTKIEKEMLKLVKESLPEQTANQMKEFIQEAEQTKRSLAAAEKDIAVFLSNQEKTNLEIANHIEEISRLSTIIHRECDLQKREDEVSDREKTIELQLTRMQLEEANARAAMVQDLAKTVFSNQSIVIQRTGNKTLPPVTDQYGGQQYPSESYNETETHTKKKEDI